MSFLGKPGFSEFSNTKVVDGSLSNITLHAQCPTIFLIWTSEPNRAEPTLNLVNEVEVKSKVHHAAWSNTICCFSLGPRKQPVQKRPVFFINEMDN